jgi:single-stranded-DNA-specific exonuclease
MDKKILGKGYLTQEDVTFQIGPRINAVGRINHPDIVYSLLIDTDPGSADKTAQYVNSFNAERKDIQKKAELEAIQRINEVDYPHGIFVLDKDWHIGVAGIVASRLVEEFGKPTIVVGEFDGAWRGSGRSVLGVNVKEILDDCSEMFVAYGGHEMAAGATLKKEYAKEAHNIFEKAMLEYKKEMLRFIMRLK